METTKHWIGNLAIFQKIAFLRKWGGRSDIIDGPFSVDFANFRRRAGLILLNPLHIELHKDKGYGHWENYRYVGPIPKATHPNVQSTASH